MDPSPARLPRGRCQRSGFRTNGSPEARRVWSKAYGRVISDDEAIEILTNVRRLAEILFRAEEEKRRT